jgi:hypothetical protein
MSCGRLQAATPFLRRSVSEAPEVVGRFHASTWLTVRDAPGRPNMFSLILIQDSDSGAESVRKISGLRGEK